MRVFFVAAAIIMALPLSARADDLPRFNVSLYCAAIPGPPGGIVACRQAEEAKRADITVRWLTFPKQRRHFCAQSVSFRKKELRSYRALEECLSEDAKTS
jgi:hypothetical protein